MAHSSLLKTLRRAFYKAHQANAQASPHTPAAAAKLTANWSRRRFIKLAALASGSAATHTLARPKFGWAAEAPRIAIVGGGIAGLNAAYQLKKAGLTATVYEARDRVGGRIRSKIGAVAPEIVSDLGGHLVNSDHADMLALAEEFNLPLFNRLEEAETLPFPKTAYFSQGEFQPEAELAERLRPLAQQILADATALEADFDAVAAELDQLSVAQYLDRYQASIPDPFIRVLIEQAIRVEYGTEPENSSALQLLFTLPLVEKETVDLLSGTDELYAVQGGSARITDSLAAALGNQVRTRMALTQVRKQGQTFRLKFGSRTVEADYVILAIPFPVLRRIEIRPALPAPMKKFVEQVDLGVNEKMLVGFKNRVWRQEAGFTQAFWSDGTAFQGNRNFAEVWDGSQRQVERAEAELTFFFGGQPAREIVQSSPRRQGERTLQAFDEIIPEARQAGNNQFLRTGWAAEPFTRGSYTTFKPGQLTEFASLFHIESEDPEERQEARVDNLIFAGEQVSDAFYGYMNGGAETGRLAAEIILRERAEAGT
jgi:monoamine oxidase